MKYFKIFIGKFRSLGEKEKWMCARKMGERSGKKVHFITSHRGFWPYLKQTLASQQVLTLGIAKECQSKFASFDIRREKGKRILWEVIKKYGFLFNVW